MFSRSIVLAGALMSLAGCATSHAGWTGANAQPFDQALASCQAQVGNLHRASCGSLTALQFPKCNERLNLG